MNLFSRAGISVVEYRDYYYFVDIIPDRPVEPAKFRELYVEILQRHGLIIAQLKSSTPILRLMPFKEKKSRLSKYRFPLTILTIITVFFTGLGLFESLHKVLGSDPGPIWIVLEASSYTAIFLGVLLSHEIGHLFMSKKSTIPAEGPFLIPAPPIQLGFLGTLGAVIFVKTPPVSRKDLARLGISGPLVGFITATIVGIVGLYLSPVLPPSVVETLAAKGEIGFVQFASTMFILLTRIMPVEGAIFVHPFLFASYVVYLVTFLNLLPIGQLDGGHVIRSITSNEVYGKISLLTPISLFVLGMVLQSLLNAGLLYFSLGLLSTILYMVLGRFGHPGVANQYDESRCACCIIVYIVLFALTIPLPII